MAESLKSLTHHSVRVASLSFGGAVSHVGKHDRKGDGKRSRQSNHNEIQPEQEKNTRTHIRKWNLNKNSHDKGIKTVLENLKPLHF